MIRYIIIGLALFLAFALFFLPASLVAQALQATPGVGLLRPAGTVWNGSGELRVDGQPLGVLQWQFVPAALLSGRGEYDFDLQLSNATAAGQPSAINGRASYGLDGMVAIAAQGDVDAAVLTPWLRSYEITMGGRLTSNNISANLDPENFWQTATIDGKIDWSGGLASYYLAGTLARQRLPSMQAILNNTEKSPRELRAEVYGEESFALMTLGVSPSGFAKIGISKRLSQIVGTPWPGSDPDHAIVLEVEQPVF